MSWLRPLIALVLIALLAGGPELGLARVAGAPSDCAMASMDHHPTAADGAGALAAICKIQCQLSADLPRADIGPVMSRVAWVQETPDLATWTTRSIPPESPPPRA